MQLGGSWKAMEATEALRRVFPDPDLDDEGWHDLVIPGHWRSSPGLATADGPMLYRRPFETGPAHDPEQRLWLQLDGIFYDGDVWLDKSYLGDTEGYFFPHTFEITDAWRQRDEHLLAVEVACTPPSDRTAKRSLTGVFQHWDCFDRDWNPGGIWQPVHLQQTGPVRLHRLRVLCSEATSERATLEVQAILDASRTGTVDLVTTLGRDPERPVVRTVRQQPLASGSNRVAWRLSVDRPELWWPAALGDQPLYDLQVEVVVNGATSDQRGLRTGLRQIRMSDFIATINGERLFLKGANLGPTRRALADASPADLERDVVLARQAGLDLLRIHGHISRPELYDAADRHGLLLWQDLPLQWGYASIRRQAVRQAEEAVDLLGHHPAVAIWCGHNQPVAVDVDPTFYAGARDESVPVVDVEKASQLPRRTRARLVAGQLLPTWNKTALDRSIRRALEKADKSRPVVAHSGVLPHPAWGTDSHLYWGWYHGDEREFPAALARLPVLARFVSEFGAQAVPVSADFCQPRRWPDLDWPHLARAHGLQKVIFDRYVPPAAYATFAAWRDATQRYQATLIRHHVETLRRLKYRPTGGFCQFLLADGQPAVSWSVLDHDRLPKKGYEALAAACAPVIVVADRPDATYRPGQTLSLDLHVVSDLRTSILGARVDADLTWPGGGQRWSFEGDVEPDSCARVGTVRVALPPDSADGPVILELDLQWGGDKAHNRYDSEVRNLS